jgi:N-methylhydantoinase B/oxoprolinase/acetone carboxylase alpha subunit
MASSAAGGSHLPDLTIIMPAFHEGKIIFWTAARAVRYHLLHRSIADVDSITPISEVCVAHVVF